MKNALITVVQGVHPIVMIRIVCCGKETHPAKRCFFVRYLLHTTYILHYLHAVMSYINIFVIQIPVLKFFGAGTERGSPGYQGEAKAILILEPMFDTLTKFMIRQIHKARIGAECD